MAWTEEAHWAWSRGIYRVTPPVDPKFPEGAIYDGLNMVYDRESNNPETMPGNSQLGTTTIGVVSGLFDYNNGGKLVASSEDGKLYEYNGTDWAAESGGRASSNSTTPGKRWAGTMFWGATTGQQLLILANNDDADDPVKYDGSDATSLGGSPPGNGQYPTVWQGRLWLADDTTLYGSRADDVETWAPPDGVNLAVYKGYDGDITGMASFANNLFIFKRSSIFRIAPTGSFASESILRNVSTSVGCVSHQTIKEDENGLWFKSEHGLERIVPSGNTSGFTVRNMTRWVKPIFDWQNRTHADKSWALYNLARLEYSMWHPTASKSVPSWGLIGNMAYPRDGARWTNCNKGNLTAGVIFNESNTDYVQYVGDTNGKVWKMNDKTSYEWGGGALSSRMQTKYYTQGRPNRMKRYGPTYMNVDMNGNYAVNVRLRLLRRGLNSFGGNLHTLANQGGDQGWGVGEWGVALWGGTAPAGERIRPVAASRGTGLQVVVESDRWFRGVGTVINSKMLSSRIAA